MDEDFVDETLRLIATLSLSDIDGLDASRKGKAREDAPLTERERESWPSNCKRSRLRIS
jgi:hypothetical protein